MERQFCGDAMNLASAILCFCPIFSVALCDQQSVTLPPNGSGFLCHGGMWDVCQEGVRPAPAGHKYQEPPAASALGRSCFRAPRSSSLQGARQPCHSVRQRRVTRVVAVKSPERLARGGPGGASAPNGPGVSAVPTTLQRGLQLPPQCATPSYALFSPGSI